MNTFIYLLAAFFIGSFAVRAYESDRRDPVRLAFVRLSALVVLLYLGFAGYLATGWNPLRVVHILASAFVPAAGISLLVRMMGEEEPGEERRMWLLSAAAVLACVPLLVVLGAAPDAALPLPVLPASVWSFVGMGWCFVWMTRKLTRSPPGIQRARIRYLLILMGGAIGFTFLEATLRVYGRWLESADALQGALPPVGAVLSAWLLYILHRIIALYRLIDLQETFSQALALTFAALMLVGFDAITVYWWSQLSAPQNLHIAFQIFLLTLAFLSVFEPLRERLDLWTNQWLNLQGHRLELTFQDLDRALAKVITLQDLESELLGRLHASGRVPLTSLYLWEEGMFRLTLERGVHDRPLMQAIADRPFTDGFRAGQRSYTAAALAPRAARHEDDAARLKAMEAMDADLTLSIMSGELVVGWLNLKSDDRTDGFSLEEIRRLQRIVDRTAVVMENLRGLEQLKEQHRLAALGTMAAGLAHEIRNPLAGIKGAAQYLQGDVTGEELDDFVSLIVEETDRLNEVVSQFLTYARPFKAITELGDVNELVERALGLIRAEGHPEAVQLEARLAEGLPEVPMDRDRVQQVLLNLIHNALHAIAGAGHIEIRTGVGQLRRRSARGRPALVIAVCDDGVGITSEDLKKLFIPFFTTRPKGTGLGLAISRRLIEAHGGEIEARSKPGQGSVFTVRLPLAEEPSPPTEPPRGDRRGQPRLRLVMRGRQT